MVCGVRYWEFCELLHLNLQYVLVCVALVYGLPYWVVKQLLNQAAKLFLQEAWGEGWGGQQGQSHGCSWDKLFPLGCAALCALEVFVLSLFCFPLTCSHIQLMWKWGKWGLSKQVGYLFFSFLVRRCSSAMSGVMERPLPSQKGNSPKHLKIGF